MLIYLFYSIALFLFVLVGFLRGAAKSALEGIFLILMLVICGIGIYINGWHSILIFIGIWILGGNFIITPIAKTVARRLITYPDLVGLEDYNRGRLEQLKKDFGSEAYVKRHAQEAAEETRHKNEMVSMAMGIPAIAKVLTQFDATERDLATLYDCFAVRSLPPRFRKTVFENVSLVSFYLQNSKSCTIYDGSYGRDLSKSASIRLQLWARSNPGGEEPHIR